MNTTLIRLGLCLVVCGMASAVQAQDWIFEGSGLFLQRNTNRNSFDYFTSAANQLDPSRDLDFDFEAGLRFRAAYATYRWEIEGVATYLNDWTARSTGTYVADELSFDLNAVGTSTPMAIVNALSVAAVREEEPNFATRINTAEHLNPGFQYAADYRSSWDDYELNANFILSQASWLKFGIGARTGSLDEFFNLSLGVVDGSPGAEFDDLALGPNLTEELRHDSLTATGGDPANVNNTIVGGGLTLVSGGADGFRGDVIGGAAALGSLLDIDFDADVENQLTGAQVALLGVLLESDRGLVEAKLKAGVYYNNVSGLLTETYLETNREASRYERTYSDNADAVAFLGNVGLTAGWKHREHILFKLGYEVMFLSGVALAADQWRAVKADNFNRTTYQVDASGSLFLHGGNASVEVIW